MKLTITQFYDPKPLAIGDADDFTKSLSEWRKRQVPEARPVLISDGIPIDDKTESQLKKFEDWYHNGGRDYHEQHRLRYEGWESDLNQVTNGKVWLWWKPDGEFEIQKENGVLYSGEILSVTTFELILKENNIEIKKI